MNEEEKEAINYLKDFRNNVYNGVGTGSVMAKNIDIIFAIIEKQQKEIENRLNEIKCLYNFISIREERIDELVEINEKYNDLYISKDKIRKLKEIVHKTLDNNGITRVYQLTIDNYFKELLEE